MKTPAQHEAFSSLNLLLKSDEDLYRNRHNFRLQANEIVHISHRITLTYEDMVEVEDEDFDGNPVFYEENRDEEFYYHVWFSRDGHVWFLISDKPFPYFGKDILYWGDDNQYDRSFEGRGSRRYFFNDVIQPSVKKALEARVEGLKSHYVWNVSEFNVFEYNEDVSIFD